MVNFIEPKIEFEIILLKSKIEKNKDAGTAKKKVIEVKCSLFPSDEVLSK